MSKIGDDLITAGLETLERSRRNEPVKSARGSPTSVQDIVQRARSAQLARRRLKEHINAVNIAMKKWQDKREIDLAALPVKMRVDLIAAELPGERDKQIGLKADEIIKHRSTIHLAEQAIEATARLFTDPVVYVDSNSIGSDKRSVYDAQLQHAGPARLADAFLLADAKGDHDLFASANSKLGSLSASDKKLVGTRVDHHSIAESMVGEQLKFAVGAISAIKYFSEDARFDSDTLNGKPHPTAAKTEVGLRKMIAEADGPQFLKDEEPPAY